MGLVECKDAISRKNVPMKIWRLTDKGVMFCVSYLDFSANEIAEALKNYTASDREREVLTLMIKTLGVDLFKQFVNLYIAFKLQPDSFATVALITQLQQQLKNKTLSPEDNDRIKLFFEKLMAMNAKTRLLLKNLKKLGIL
jgi:predicted transport protein